MKSYRLLERSLWCTKGGLKRGIRNIIPFFVNVKGAINDDTDPQLHSGIVKVTDCGDRTRRGYETKYYDSSIMGT